MDKMSSEGCNPFLVFCATEGILDCLPLKIIPSISLRILDLICGRCSYGITSVCMSANASSFGPVSPLFLWVITKNNAALGLLLLDQGWDRASKPVPHLHYRLSLFSKIAVARIASHSFASQYIRRVQVSLPYQFCGKYLTGTFRLCSIYKGDDPIPRLMCIDSNSNCA